MNSESKIAFSIVVILGWIFGTICLLFPETVYKYETHMKRRLKDKDEYVYTTRIIGVVVSMLSLIGLFIFVMMSII